MKNRYIQKCIVFVCYIIVRLLIATLRIRFTLPTEPLSDSKSYIFAFWHGELLLMSFFYRHLLPHTPASVIISHHSDGDLIARFNSYYNIGALRGSTRKGAVKVLAQSLSWLKNGKNLAITPDGPKGPRHSVADGIVALSQKCNTDIVPLQFKATQFWQLNSWDKFIIPKPFSEVELVAKTPFSLNNLSMDEAKSLITSQLLS